MRLPLILHQNVSSLFPNKIHLPLLHSRFPNHSKTLIIRGCTKSWRMLCPRMSSRSTSAHVMILSAKVLSCPRWRLFCRNKVQANNIKFICVMNILTREGKASIVTGDIEGFQERGIEMKNGETVEADFVILATGLNLQKNFPFSTIQVGK